MDINTPYIFAQPADGQRNFPLRGEKLVGRAGKKQMARVCKWHPNVGISFSRQLFQYRLVGNKIMFYLTIQNTF